MDCFLYYIHPLNQRHPRFRRSIYQPLKALNDTKEEKKMTISATAKTDTKSTTAETHFLLDIMISTLSPQYNKKIKLREGSIQ